MWPLSLASLKRHYPGRVDSLTSGGEYPDTAFDLLYDMVENNDGPVVVQIPIARQGKTTFMHAVVVVGFDNEGSDIVVMDPDPNGSPGLQSVPRAVFLQTWAMTDFTAFYFES